MKLNSIIHRYLFREMLSPFALNLMFFTFVFLLTEILEITNMIVNYRIGLLVVGRMLAYSMPYFLVFVIPMSVMTAILLTFLKMSGDNEITALKSSGIGLYQLLPPVLIFCTLGCLLTGIMTIKGLPWGRISLKKLTFEVARKNIDIGLKERTFNNSFKSVMLYVNKIDMKSKELIDVFIQDERSQETGVTIMAPRGILSSDPENLRFRLRLFDGTINQASPVKRTANTVRFDKYDISLDLQKNMAQSYIGEKGEKEMSLSELRKRIRNSPQKDAPYYSALIEYHRKFSIPAACFALGLLAVPLGVESRRAKRSFGLALGLLMFLFYYLLLSAGLVFGEAGIYPPVIGMWVPNIVIGMIGACLLVRNVNGRPLHIVDMLTRRLKFLGKSSAS